MKNVFISYHHANDQAYKEALINMNNAGSEKIFIDGSVDTGDIPDDLTDEQIRVKIRDEYLKNTTVTIVLVGSETKNRKHVDWEIFSSMFDGKVNKKSGILVVMLPSVDGGHYTATHSNEKETIYPEQSNWVTITSREEYERRYPYVPARIIDNLLNKKANISIVSWKKIYQNRENLRFLIEATGDNRTNCEYDMSRQMKRYNS